MRQHIRISQCMIVKNEEMNLERALSWGRDIMWEQIVVDTGSSDQSVAIAERMGAKVFHFPWIDDFSAAKNYAIDQAGGDWIVFLDADEYLPFEDARKLPSVLTQLNHHPCHALTANWIQADSAAELTGHQTEGKLSWISTVKADGSQGFSLSGTVVRIFRRDPAIRYHGRIHETLRLPEGGLFCLDPEQKLSVIHTGYSAKEMKIKNKTERNIALIKRELEDHPNDFKMLTCLADSYFQQKQYEEAARWYEKAAAWMPDELDETNIQGAMVLKHLLLLYLEQEDEEAALDAYHRGIRRFPKDADYDYLMGQRQARAGQFRQGGEFLERALALLNQHAGTSPLLSHNLLAAWELLIRCHYENGQLSSCVSCAVTILKADPFRRETLKLLLLAFRRDEERQRTGHSVQAASPEQVKAFLGRLYDFSNEEQQRFVAEAAREAGYPGL